MTKSNMIKRLMKEGGIALIIVVILFGLLSVVLSLTKNLRTKWMVENTAIENLEAEDKTSGVLKDTDAWGRNLFSYYTIEYDNLEIYKVVSCGPDGELDTEDDIIFKKRDLTKWLIWHQKEMQRLIDKCDKLIDKANKLIEETD